MLTRLSIKNYALIDDVEIQFDSGLTVITGETGAGKSILLGALSLVLGARAERSFFKDQSKKCSIEAWFNIKDYGLQDFFQKNDLDYDSECIIRREINLSGKSRIFVNDTPCNLDVVQSLGKSLIDIHSQNQSLEINEESFKFKLLDTLASNGDLLKEYHESFNKLQFISLSIKETEEQLQESKKLEDYLQFQLEELVSLKLKAGEESELENEHQVLVNAEEILLNTSKFNALLEDSDPNLLEGLREAKNILQKLAAHNEAMSDLGLRLESSIIEIRDIQSELIRFVEEFNRDENRLQYLEERLGDLHRLKQKHGLLEADGLIALELELSDKLSAISSFDDKLSSLNKQLVAEEFKSAELASKLSSRRQKVIAEMQKSIVQVLSDLEIQDAVFEVQLETRQNLNKFGKDQVAFLFSANKGIRAKELSATASGGEVSRLMLSLKSQLAKHLKLPTVLFDEIDTGISGEVAKKMGAMLSRLGKQRQVISISHLPQIAARADHHLLVYKSENLEKTNSNIKELNQEERIVEISKMLSGNQISEAARNNAKDLINNN